MNQRRPRGRNNNNNNNRGRHQNPRNQSFDSNGPEGRVRGSATQVLERYLAQARDAQAAGDGVLAENLFQHAEHYYRILSAANAQNEQQREARQANSFDDRRGNRSENGDGPRGEDANDGRQDVEAKSDAEEQSEAHARASEGDKRQSVEDVESDAPPVRQRSRRRASPASEADDEAADIPAAPAQAESAGDAAADGASIDAAFLKAPPKPRRRRRPVSETEAAD